MKPKIEIGDRVKNRNKGETGIVIGVIDEELDQFEKQSEKHSRKYKIMVEWSENEIEKIKKDL